MPIKTGTSHKRFVSDFLSTSSSIIMEYVHVMGSPRCHLLPGPPLRPMTKVGGISGHTNFIGSRVYLVTIFSGGISSEYNGIMRLSHLLRPRPLLRRHLMRNLIKRVLDSFEVPL